MARNDPHDTENKLPLKSVLVVQWTVSQEVVLQWPPSQESALHAQVLRQWGDTGESVAGVSNTLSHLQPAATRTSSPRQNLSPVHLPSTSSCCVLTVTDRHTPAGKPPVSRSPAQGGWSS